MRGLADQILVEEHDKMSQLTRLGNRYLHAHRLKQRHSRACVHMHRLRQRHTHAHAHTHRLR